MYSSQTICNVTCRYPAPAGEGSSSAAFAADQTDTALANADAAIGGLTECGVPQRRNLPGGGIVQLGPRSFPGLGTGLQQGWAFSAGRHVYTVEVDGRPYDEAAAPTPAERTDHWMPLTEAQLAALTETLAAIG